MFQNIQLVLILMEVLSLPVTLTTLRLTKVCALISMIVTLMVSVLLTQTALILLDHSDRTAIEVSYRPMMVLVPTLMNAFLCLR